MFYSSEIESKMTPEKEFKDITERLAPPKKPKKK